MKKIITLLTILIFLSPLAASADSLGNRLSGKIVLQVEKNGEAWYINPDNQKRYFLGRPADAFQIMRELGLGVSNEDFDSWGDYAPNRLSGKIILKVEDNGKAYYVDPSDLKMHYLGSPKDAFEVMRGLGLGITNEDIKLIKAISFNKDLKIFYPQKWYELGYFNGFCGNLNNIGLDNQIIEKFKNSLSSDVNIDFDITSDSPPGEIYDDWYLEETCFNKKSDFLPYFVKRDPYSIYIGIYDIKNDEHTYFKSEENMLIAGDQGSCSLHGMKNEKYVIYSCGGGDGPGWESDLYSLNIKTKQKHLIEGCTSFKGSVTCE